MELSRNETGRPMTEIYPMTAFEDIDPGNPEITTAPAAGRKAA
jgi:hypothetical protein